MERDVLLARLLVKHLGAAFIPLHPFAPPAKEGDFGGQVDIEKANEERAAERQWLTSKAAAILADLNKVPAPPTVMLADVMTGKMRPHELFTDEQHSSTPHTHDPGGRFRYPKTTIGEMDLRTAIRRIEHDMAYSFCDPLNSIVDPDDLTDTIIAIVRS